MEEDDWIEEEVLVHVDYKKMIPIGELADPDMQFKIIGLDQETVYSEVNGKFFAGMFQPGQLLRH